VGNIARSGVGSEGLDLILARVLPRYPRLQVIVILVGASDVLRWLEVGAPSALPPPVETAEVFRCHPEMTFDWKLKALALTELARRMRMRWLRPTQVHDRACRWIGRARAMRAGAKEVRTAMPDPAPMLAHFDVHFRRALRRAQGHADRVIVIRQPWFGAPRTPEELAHMWHGSVGRAWQEDVTTFYSLDVLSRLMTLLDAKAARVAQDLGVEQLDVAPILERGLETYYDSFHATPAGARAVAASLAKVILRQPVPSVNPAALAASDSVEFEKVS
jgi:lysophospholipase L1-like esterase